MDGQQGVTSQQIFDMLMESQYWPPEDMLAYQRSQLAQLLRHAKANVPFYKTRLDCVFRRDGSIDWDRWEDIPVVTREDMRDRREELQARVLPPGHGPKKSFFSSGSTGIPIEVTNCRIADLVRMAGLQRMRTAYGLPLNVKAKQYELLTSPKQRQGKTPASVQPDDEELIDLSLPEDEKLELLRKFRVDLFFGFATAVVLAARVNLTLGKPLRLMGVATHGMGLTNAERDLIELSFGCPCASIYSSKECGLIAFTCPNTRNYHQCPELVFMERPKPETVENQFVPLLTPIFNTAQPLIRYRQGDILEVSEPSMYNGDCGCSNTLPVFKTVIGRQDSFFIFEGVPIPILGIDDALLIRELKALAAQVAQTGPDKIEIRFVSKQPAKQTAKTKIKLHLCALFKRKLIVDFRQMDVIPVNAGGKLNRYVREYAP